MRKREEGGWWKKFLCQEGKEGFKRKKEQCGRAVEGKVRLLVSLSDISYEVGKNFMGKEMKEETKSRKHLQAVSSCPWLMSTSFHWLAELLFSQNQAAPWCCPGCSQPSLWNLFSPLLPFHIRPVHLSSWPAPTFWLSKVIFKLDHYLEICPQGMV